MTFMDRFDPLFDPALFEGLGYEVNPEERPRMSLQSVNRLKQLRGMAEPKINLGDLQLIFKLFNSRISASYPLLGGSLTGTVKPDNYNLQYQRQF